MQSSNRLVTQLVTRFSESCSVLRMAIFMSGVPSETDGFRSIATFRDQNR